MEIIDATLRASGWPDAATVLRERWIDAALPFADAHFHDRFPASRTSGFISRPTGARWAPTGRACHLCPTT